MAGLLPDGHHRPQPLQRERLRVQAVDRLGDVGAVALPLQQAVRVGRELLRERVDGATEGGRDLPDVAVVVEAAEVVGRDGHPLAGRAVREVASARARRP